MTPKNTVKNRARQVKGKAKQVVGKVTRNKKLEAAGVADMAIGEVKQRGSTAKDAVTEH